MNGYRTRKILNKKMNSKRKRPCKKMRIRSTAERNFGRQAAYEKLLSYELCRDLIREFASKSARKVGDDVGSIHFRYNEIVTEFRALNDKGQSLSEMLYDRYKTNRSLGKFLTELNSLIRRYVFACIDEIQHEHPCKLGNSTVSDELMNSFAKEYLRDHGTLTRFLSAVFERWQEILNPEAIWRVHLVTQQKAEEFEHNRKRILIHLQEIGAITPNLTTVNQDCWLLRIGQCLSRDRRTAVARAEKAAESKRQRAVTEIR